jgi:hypothetical protein
MGRKQAITTFAALAMALSLPLSTGSTGNGDAARLVPTAGIDSLEQAPIVVAQFNRCPNGRCR